jgi:hypothetical protein
MARLNLDLLVEQVQSVAAQQPMDAATTMTSSEDLALRDLATRMERGDALDTQLELIWH